MRSNCQGLASALLHGLESLSVLLAVSLKKFGQTWLLRFLVCHTEVDAFQCLSQVSWAPAVFGGPPLEEFRRIMAVVLVAKGAGYEGHECSPVGGELGNK